MRVETRPSTAWHPADTHADAALRSHVWAVLGDGDVRTGRLCPGCGSDRHGAPWARHHGRPVHVSLSRSGAHLLTAVSTTGPLGVDVESVAAVASRWDPALVLAPGERAEADDDRAWHWVAKEALLKAYGVGLARPMTSVRLADEQVSRVPSPDGYVAALARATLG